MKLSIIVAASENNVIGNDNTLIWHLPGDLKHFKNITSGHSVIMGRRTFESIGKALPNRRNIVITRNSSFSFPGIEIAADTESALAMVSQEEEVFIIGGGSIYNKLWNRADKLYLTIVHTRLEGDTSIPSVNSDEWKEIKREAYEKDDKNEYDYTFLEYERGRECVNA